MSYPPSCEVPTTAVYQFNPKFWFALVRRSRGAQDDPGQPIWTQAIIPSEPDAWIWLGDMAYLDHPVSFNGVLFADYIVVSWLGDTVLKIVAAVPTILTSWYLVGGYFW